MTRVLYQFNVAVMRFPYDDPRWDAWKKMVPLVHHQAEAADGFVANHDCSGSPLGYMAPYPRDPLVMGNLSAWRDEDALGRFTFTGTHGALMRQRHKWFTPWAPGVVSIALWWDLPDKFNIETAKRNLALLQAHGPTHDVFSWNSLAS